MRSSPGGPTTATPAEAGGGQCVGPVQRRKEDALTWETSTPFRGGRNRNDNPLIPSWIGGRRWREGRWCRSRRPADPGQRTWAALPGKRNATAVHGAAFELHAVHAVRRRGSAGARPRGVLVRQAYRRRGGGFVAEDGGGAVGDREPRRVAVPGVRRAGRHSRGCPGPQLRRAGRTPDPGHLRRPRRLHLSAGRGPGTTPTPRRLPRSGERGHAEPTARPGETLAGDGSGTSSGNSSRTRSTSASSRPSARTSSPCRTNPDDDIRAVEKDLKDFVRGCVAETMDEFQGGLRHRRTRTEIDAIFERALEILDDRGDEAAREAAE